MKTKQAKSSGKEKQRIVTAVDLFCGAGGTSTGLAQACKRRGYKLRLLAINHWEIANPKVCNGCATLWDAWIAVFGNKRETLYGRRLRVLARGAMNSALVEFENGQREIISRNALRKVR